ncbi:protein POLLEN DEFECTIVE IN GUIDANCE 1 [Selaginella moellendorffii]|uniref:protein POLLEN DEFECTIVE IN GUIDANCE 1 n=1 Tax=Selaginella moellendorffii TaxID=88036 RepID=UPI000D1CFC22|nr:protein POLLEN DEFECTIVE IN GUIDANCE 1 [Selaginella moellendorffii]XP_024521426.1 protein POLLEN DEFECTIVE IN GUIDANCE 1 [Selaginella moellendorffii]|eukprot:XP_024521425.1 protein POLLEN DEFECTIVE IN GUIDANCE 1 [Selaginella moellendorffii]
MVLPNRVRNFRTVGPSDWCDLCCLIILIAGGKALQQAEIRYIYHSIRFANIKLYVIYNMLEVFDKLFQSFGVEVLFRSAVSCTEGFGFF